VAADLQTTSSRAGFHRVTGRYTVMETCPMATPGNIFGSLCFQGGVHLEFEGIDD
jgi:hypothetical protein